MGLVHLARRPGGERVALKVLRPHIVGDDEARARLAREVGSLGRIRSKWVAEIVDADPWAPVPYVATRYVPGLPLHDHVVEHGPIEGQDLLWFAACLAEGLASVHAVGVLHRDIKPSNVLMEGRTPILIDFGLARVADDPKLTHTGWLLGTPGYLAPEILYGDDATTAADVHSWAATVAYAATGSPPFGRGPSMAIMDRVRRGEHDLSGVPEPRCGRCSTPPCGPSPDAAPRWRRCWPGCGRRPRSRGPARPPRRCRPSPPRTSSRCRSRWPPRVPRARRPHLPPRRGPRRRPTTSTRARWCCPPRWSPRRRSAAQPAAAAEAGPGLRQAPPAAYEPFVPPAPPPQAAPVADPAGAGVGRAGGTSSGTSRRTPSRCPPRSGGRSGPGAACCSRPPRSSWGPRAPRRRGWRCSAWCSSSGCCAAGRWRRARSATSGACAAASGTTARSWSSRRPGTSCSRSRARSGCCSGAAASRSPRRCCATPSPPRWPATLFVSGVVLAVLAVVGARRQPGARTAHPRRPPALAPRRVRGRRRWSCWPWSRVGLGLLLAADGVSWVPASDRPFASFEIPDGGILSR